MRLEAEARRTLASQYLAGRQYCSAMARLASGFLRGLLRHLALAFLVEAAVTLMLALASIVLFAPHLSIAEAYVRVGLLVALLGAIAYTARGVVLRVYSHALVPWAAPESTRRIIEAAEKLRGRGLDEVAAGVGGLVGSILFAFALTLL